MLRARVELAIDVRDTAGAIVARQKGTTEFPVENEALARDAAEVHVLQSEFDLAPGPYRLEVKVKDLERKTGVIPILFIGRNATGRASLDIAVPSFADSSLQISDVQFAREIEENAAESPFKKGVLSVVPCPDRVYGLLLPDLRIYFELYDRRAEGIAAERVEVSYEVASSSGESVLSRREALSLHGGGKWARSARLDLSEVPAGRYGVHVSAVRPATGDRVDASGAIDIIWSAFSWNKKLDDLLLETAPVASSEQLDQIKRLSSGERENYLAKFWKALDPTPETPRNEAFEEHYQRLRRADRAFGGRTRGIQTDRGRIFVRFGQPDEISTGFATDEFIGGFLWKPKNEFNFNEEGRARGGYNYKDKTYEIWSYDQRGRQIGASPEVGSGLGLRFIFVDVSGTGDYEMVHSSEGTEY